MDYSEAAALSIVGAAVFFLLRKLFVRGKKGGGCCAKGCGASLNEAKRDCSQAPPRATSEPHPVES